MELRRIQDAFEFEQLIEQILSGARVSLSAHAGLRDVGYDFTARAEHRTWAVEVKFYRSPRAQFSLLSRAALHLASTVKSLEATAGALLVSSEVSEPERVRIQVETGISIGDRNDLIRWATTYAPDALDRLTALLGLRSEELAYGPGIDLPDFLGIDLPKPVSPQEPQRTGHDLCEQIRRLPAGRDHWQGYERLATEALRFLFADSLLLWSDQVTTDDGLNRYDLICRLTPAKEFWRFAMDHLNSRYVVFEFKNYDGPIRQNQVLTTEKYLFEKGLRSLAVIVCRVGATEQAAKMMRGAMRESGKLMLALTDDDVCAMLHMEDRGEDATDYLFALADEFLVTLSR
jgi:hypothetical protein